MDLVFKRYSSPFFLDYSIENGKLSELVDTLLKKQDEEKMWEMYLATLPYNNKSFNEWKQETLGAGTKRKKQKMSKKEIDATIKKSQDILRGFKPPLDRRCNNA